MRLSPLALIAISSISYAAASTDLKTQPITTQISYEQYKLPNNLPSLGVLGAHVLANITPNWYAGLGFYGGVNGTSGGYFALSLDGGYTHSLYKKLWWDIGTNVGAGGGRSTAVGGGFYVEPHAGLSYHFDHFNLGAQYSYVNFTDGQIESHQWGVTLSVPTSISYGDYAHSGETVQNAYGLALSRNYIALMASAYIPNKGTRDTGGHISDGTIQLIGVDFGHYFTKRWFGYGQALGAYHGRRNGYADALLGVGYQLPLALNGKLSALARFGLGSGGGGGANTAGGFVVAPQVGLQYRFTQSFAIEANGGYLSAPAGDFNNVTASLLLKYYFDQAQPDADNQDDTGPLSYQGWRLRLGNQTYFSPRNTRGATNPTMQLIDVHFDRRLYKHLYATGQMAFAYVGEATGGYFSGMLGLGTQWAITSSKRLSIFGEGLVGTAGGAGLDIGSGALYEPVIGLDYALNKTWSLQTSVGRLMAFSGKFQSTVLNVGLGLRFATLAS